MCSRQLASTTANMLLSCALAANAQPGHFTVPFEFTVGTTALSRDIYSVATDGTFRYVILRSVVTATVQPARRRISESRHEPTLVFHRYGQRYFLRRVFFAGRSWYLLRQTRQERVAKNQSRESAFGSAPVIVSIVAGRASAPTPRSSV